MTDLATVVARTRSLERTCRLLTLAVTVLAASLVLLAAMPAERGAGAGGIDARAFRLLGGSGAVVAELKVGKDGPGLFLLDGEGRQRAALVHQPSQTGLFLKDEAGDARVGVAQFAHGGGGVALHGESMKGAAVLYLEGEGSLSFYDGEGGVRLRLPVKEEAP